MATTEQRLRKKWKPVTLRTLADYVGLAPCSISAVLNNAPAAKRIPLQTKQRILRAAAKFSYAPNQAARALRTRRTRSIALVMRDMEQRFFGEALAVINRTSSLRGYLLVLATWEGSAENLASTALQLERRGIEGIILVGCSWDQAPALPTVQLHLDSPATERCPALQQAEQMTARLIDDIEWRYRKT